MLKEPIGGVRGSIVFLLMCSLVYAQLRLPIIVFILTMYIILKYTYV